LNIKAFPLKKNNLVLLGSLAVSLVTYTNYRAADDFIPDKLVPGMIRNQPTNRKRIILKNNLV
jgi:hypothetical protein